MADEMRVADEEAREVRLRKRLERELIEQEYKKQQRKALMPMYRNLPDFIEENHKNSTFIKDKNLTTVKGVLPEGH